jgi:hypothetical protein
VKDKYILEIYYPTPVAGSVMAYFTSDTPFQAIGTGDIINTSSLPDANHAIDLRVTSIEHILWTLENGESKHKVCVYTEGLDGSARM